MLPDYIRIPRLGKEKSQFRQLMLDPPSRGPLANCELLGKDRLVVRRPRPSTMTAFLCPYPSRTKLRTGSGLSWRLHRGKDMSNNALVLSGWQPSGTYERRPSAWSARIEAHKSRLVPGYRADPLQHLEAQTMAQLGIQQAEEQTIRDAESTAGWNTTHIVLVSVLGTVACMTLLVSVFYRIMTQRKIMILSTALDNVVVELGAQQEQVTALREAVSRRDAYIAHNVMKGPQAYSVASPERLVRPLYLDVSNNDVFVVDGGERGDGCGDQSESPSLDQSLQSPAARPAVVVQPGDVRTLTLQPRRLQRPGAPNPDMPDSRGFRPRRRAEAPSRKAHQGNSQGQKAPLENQGPRDPSAQEAPQADRYWLGHGGMGALIQQALG